MKNFKFLILLMPPFLMAFLIIFADFLKTGRLFEYSESLSQNFTIFFLIGCVISILLCTINFTINDKNLKEEEK